MIVFGDVFVKEVLDIGKEILGKLIKKEKICLFFV